MVYQDRDNGTGFAKTIVKVVKIMIWISKTMVQVTMTMV